MECTSDSKCSSGSPQPKTPHMEKVVGLTCAVDVVHPELNSLLLRL